MLSLFKYIVFFIFCFNIAAASAAEVIVDFDDETPVDFEALGRADLPDAAQMQSILYDDDTNELGRVILLGKYFDAKYPDDQINADFSNDVAVIFPELSQQEVYDRTNYIRHAVNLYRWGVKKYTDIKAKLAAPEEPPLIADDDDYDDPKKYTYIKTDPDKTAVVYDFKKVLSYGNNPRDLKAMEAKRQRAAESKKSKTAFDKFKSMAGKLEFSKLPFYGITLPNPLVGNAGVGDWLYADGFKARLITEIAEIKSVNQFLGAIHVSVPEHRFMLANNLSESLQKPRIIFEEMQNIKAYKVHYSMPVTVLSNTMVAGYSGDFAFPIEFETIEPDKPIKLKAKLVFNSCDKDLNCSLMDFMPEVQIAVGQENEYSGLQNFIRQSFYNLPQSYDKNFKLKKTSLIFDDDNNVKQLQFAFAFRGKVNNFALFLEDEQYTQFTRPQLTIQNNLIYVTVEPLNNADKLLNSEVVLTTRLNNYTAITQTVKLLPNEPDLAFGAPTLAAVLRLSLFAGLLFGLFPAGLGWLLLSIAKFDYRRLLPVISGIFIGANLMAFLAAKFYAVNFIWGMQFSSFAYLSATLAAFMLILSGLQYADNLSLKHRLPLGVLFGILIVFCFPLYSVPFAPYIADYFSTAPIVNKLLIANLAALGIAAPYFAMFIFNKFKPDYVLPAKLKALALTLAVILLLITAISLAGRLVLQLTLWQILKFAALILIIKFIFAYLLRFLQALKQVDLPQQHKSIAQKIIYALFCLVVVGFTIICRNQQNLNTPDKNNTDYMAPMQKYVTEGKNVIVAVEPKWCFSCRLNSFVTFNKRNLDRWNKDFKLEYIRIDSADNKQTFELLKQYNQISLPVYMLFNYQFENGITLSSFIDETSLQQTLENF
jgi:hypothetical protein